MPPEHPSADGPVRFTIDRVFPLASRQVVIATGRIRHGVIRPGTTLHIDGGADTVRVIGIELLPAPPDDPDRVGLIIDSRDAQLLTPGATLTDTT